MRDIPPTSLSLSTHPPTRHQDQPAFPHHYTSCTTYLPCPINPITSLSPLPSYPPIANLPLTPLPLTCMPLVYAPIAIELNTPISHTHTHSHTHTPTRHAQYLTIYSLISYPQSTTSIFYVFPLRAFPPHSTPTPRTTPHIAYPHPRRRAIITTPSSHAQVLRLP